jgi:hypothetical protein
MNRRRNDSALRVYDGVSAKGMAGTAGRRERAID